MTDRQSSSSDTFGMRLQDVYNNFYVQSEVNQLYKTPKLVFNISDLDPLGVYNIYDWSLNADQSYLTISLTKCVPAFTISPLL
jgi:hypothetical protein